MAATSGPAAAAPRRVARRPAVRRDRRCRGGRPRQLRQRRPLRAVPLVAADRPSGDSGDPEPAHGLRPPPTDRQAVVAISQSGASPDVVEVLRRRAAGLADRGGHQRPDSPLAEAAGACSTWPRRGALRRRHQDLHGIAAGGGGAALALDDRDERPRRTKPSWGRCRCDDAAIDATTGLGASRGARATPRGVVVGRGLNLCTAYETALKITELTGSLMAPYSRPTCCTARSGPSDRRSRLLVAARRTRFGQRSRGRGRGGATRRSGGGDRPEGTSVDGPVAATVALYRRRRQSRTG